LLEVIFVFKCQDEISKEKHYVRLEMVPSFTLNCNRNRMCRCMRNTISINLYYCLSLCRTWMSEPTANFMLKISPLFKSTMNRADIFWLQMTLHLYLVTSVVIFSIGCKIIKHQERYPTLGTCRLRGELPYVFISNSRYNI